MRRLPEGLDYYLVTDARLSARGSLHDVAEAVRAGCRIVQYREKDAPTRTMVREAKAMRDLCVGRAVFLVNDRVDVALASGADGVHLGQDDMPYDDARRLLGPDAVIGITVHDADEAVEAERLGADYVGLSPIFSTSTKADAGSACGVDMIPLVRRRIGLPIAAIGGIGLQNAGEVVAAGADMVCAISAVVASEDVYGRTRELIGIVGRARG